MAATLSVHVKRAGTLSALFSLADALGAPFIATAIRFCNWHTLRTHIGYLRKERGGTRG